MENHRPLPQEFPRALASLALADVAPDLAPGAREAFTAAFERRQAEPLAAGGAVRRDTPGMRLRVRTQQGGSGGPLVQG